MIPVTSGRHLTYKAPEKKKEAMGIPNSSNHNPLHIFGLVFYVVGNVSCLRSAIERKREDGYCKTGKRSAG